MHACAKKNRELNRIKFIEMGTEIKFNNLNLKYFIIQFKCITENEQKNLKKKYIYGFSGILKENKNCRFITGDVKFI